MFTMQTYKVEVSEEEKEKRINDSLPFIKYTAYRLSKRLPPQLSVEDLISVGIAGLLEALQRFDEGRVKFSTFAEYRIKGAMLDELRAHDWVPRSLKDKVNVIKRAHYKLEQELGRTPREEEIADSLDMPLAEYRRVLQSASNAVVFSFEDFVDRGGSDDGDMDIMQSLPDPDAKTPLQLCEDKDTKELLARQIDVLPHREKLVLSLYYWDELTMKEIGKVLDITEGRVCQIHNQALIRLKAQLEARFAQ